MSTVAWRPLNFDSARAAASWRCGRPGPSPRASPSRAARRAAWWSSGRSGDQLQDVRLSEVGGKGLFVKEIEDALLRKRDRPCRAQQQRHAGAPPRGADDRRACCRARIPGTRWCCRVRARVASGPTARHSHRRISRRADLSRRSRISSSHLGQSPRIGTGSVRRVSQLTRLLPGANFQGDPRQSRHPASQTGRRRATMRSCSPPPASAGLDSRRASRWRCRPRRACRHRDKASSRSRSAPTTTRCGASWRGIDDPAAARRARRRTGARRSPRRRLSDADRRAGVAGRRRRARARRGRRVARRQPRRARPGARAAARRGGARRARRRAAARRRRRRDPA